MFWEIISKTMDEPQMFGLYHFIWLFIILVVSVILSIVLKNASLKRYKLVIFIMWIIIIGLEVIKELSLAYRNSWEYVWSAFPFQFCSTIFYVIPLLLISSPNKGKLSKFVFYSTVGFTATYLFFGGLITIINAQTIFSTYIFINIQTMIHHGSQVVLGIITMVYFRKELNFKIFLRGSVLFLVFVLIAFIMNETFILFLPDNSYFNMFFISRFYDPPKVALSFYNMVPYPVYLIGYILGFSLSAFVIYVIPRLIIKARS